MVQGDILGNSTLHMSDVPVSGNVLQTDWSSLLTNRIMMVAAILTTLLMLPCFFKTLGPVISCIRISRANATLEHSYSQASMRNQTAWAQLLPLALLADRFGLISPAYLEKIPDIWHAPAVLGILLAYLFMRLLLFILLKPRRISTETSSTVHHILFTMSIALSVASLCTAGAMLLCQAPDSAIRSVLLWETVIFYGLTLLREGQILRSNCSGFSTILYLCALEMVPAICLICAVTIY